ncbi:MAG: hypothetical protein UX04_C0001G0117 [Microgenomates group bacterium GW2011_GWF2_45_18]|nr:MAG: hypothetical protein UW18_C0003G0113 [Microgenomates group bacterium GW2011_GWF1_44_10]KKU02346.1 MAG: hypothetical protein UX04_C0001G0117 [Microgenomates group bacterium GW2011_GWF2_45_18]OGJ41678.1 MAG: hypothetical protein A2378_02235 [Candidatus Pacebacteria bacterium RIFOXYB1_FULL_44_10]HAU99187.1 hypothetical protein [Candidatus Paceibacterota bacterium]HAX01717.1 hypothetical protein [Candidatus Paceibacterota bacterium]
MKKMWAIGGIAGTLFVALVALIISFVSGNPEPTASPVPSRKPKLTIPANTIPVSERPYVTVRPTGGREVVLVMHDLKKKADSVDFELQYASGDKQEAAIGSLPMSTTFPVTKTILLGSKSGGGKITYHENVTGGMLTLSFYDENYKLENTWNYIEMKKSIESVGSKDGKFHFTFTKPEKSQQYMIVYQSPGLPAPIEGEIIAGPYSIAGVSEFTSAGSAEVRVSKEVSTATLHTWDGKEWSSKKVTVKDKLITEKATANLLFVVTE